MLIDSSIALVDNDFITKLLDAKLREYDLIDLLNLTFSELGITGWVHPLVFEKEMVYKRKQILELFSGNVLHKLDFVDIFQRSDERKAYYLFLVNELFKTFNGEALSIKNDDILTSWIYNRNLGEIHAITTCAVCGCAIFLSDDLGSKAMATYMNPNLSFSINVYNRKEFFKKHQLEGITKINKKERSALTHV